ncbi:MAG: PfkB family carbohydrate kinase [Bacteroidales bacterium]|nr:PfkB family carbohydrate kinase [Bacteroidales bacterium]
MMSNRKRVLGTGNIGLDIIFQREYPEGFDIAKKRNPFVDKLIAEEVGNTCGNVMTMLPYLGVDTFPIGHFDDSEQGLKITASLHHYGADMRFVQNSPNGGTTLMTCIHKLDQNGHHAMSHRATAPNSRFPKRKLMRKDEVQAFLKQPDFTPDAYFFDAAEAGPRELAVALKKQGVLVYFEPENDKEQKKFLRCVEASDIIKFSGTRITDLAFVDHYRDKLFIRTLGEQGMEFNLKGIGWKHIEPVPNLNEVDWEGAGDWTTSVILAELCKRGKTDITQLTEEEVTEVLKKAAAIASHSVSYITSKGLIRNEKQQ